MNRPCPRCGKEIHEQSDFCPYCVESLNRRAAAKPPRAVPVWALWAGLAVLLCAALAAGIWAHTRPEVYEGDGGVIYTDGGMSYNICLAWDGTPFTPNAVRYTSGESNFDYRFPVMLYISHTDRDSFADAEFMEKVESFSAFFVRADEGLTISCTEPTQRRDYLPNAALVSFVDLNASAAGEYSAVITFEFNMKNGDVIRVNQEQSLTMTQALVYSWEDTPMDTAEQLQALMDELAETTPDGTSVYIYLPPVVYDGSLELGNVWTTFYGSEKNGVHTTFASPIRISNNTVITTFEDIHFTGSGSGVALSCAGRLHLYGCTVSGWTTGVLAYGTGWSWMTDTVFSGNEVGLHFNLQVGSVSNSSYTRNTFSDNGTAILFEDMGTDMELNFDGCLFSGNGVDIDNQCNHPIDTSEAVFE